MIRIGRRVSADWMERLDDMKFLKQIGIDYLDITLDMVERYRKTCGRIDRAGVDKVIDQLG